MGPYPLSKRRNRFILVITDSFSWWIEAYPLPHGDANTIGHMMDTHLFPRWGYPKTLLSDNGTQFTGKLWNELCLKWGVLHYTTPIYHPRANPTERRNQELKKGLWIRLQEQHQEWENQLPSVLFTLRNRQNTATRYSPSQILFGQTLPRPGEWSHWPGNQLEPHKDHINQRLHTLTAIQRKAVLNQENYLNRKGDPIAETQPHYQIGDQVLTWNHQLSNKAQKFHAGLAPRWKGPYTVAHNQGAVYWITRDNETIKVYETQLRPAPTTDQQHLLE
ncbi:protein NYNRIN-like [Nilaparvata lugens]|uniref:protein NYNRIN-like n=1 Tax=Nilaparvata lugens TaxID=108931 RepID=UPI00193DAED7|nr:protein NYNRIN-like [Nilaparvata lugens]